MPLLPCAALLADERVHAQLRRMRDLLGPIDKTGNEDTAAVVLIVAIELATGAYVFAQPSLDRLCRWLSGDSRKDPSDNDSSILSVPKSEDGPPDGSETPYRAM